MRTDRAIFVTATPALMNPSDRESNRLKKIRRRVADGAVIITATLEDRGRFSRRTTLWNVECKCISFVLFAASFRFFVVLFSPLRQGR
jgi:hypothetical protein